MDVTHHIASSPKIQDTTNYMEASALLAVGVPFIGCETNGRTHFIFRDDGNVKELIRQFWDGQLLVDAKTLCEKVRDAKKLIRQESHIKHGDINVVSRTQQHR